MTAGTARIGVRGLKKSFGRKTVLNGVDFDVAPGESLVVIGGSGSGKSVAIKCVLGLIEPDEGTIEIDGERAVSMDRFGVLFQGGALFDSLTVWENVAFRSILRPRGRSKEEAREAAIDTLGLVGLGDEAADLLPAELSGGMMKRVALARAIAARPDIVFFDEPTTGLDPIAARVIDDLIVSVREKLGVSTITITHDMASVRKIADRVAMLHGGKLIWTGPVDEVDASGDPLVDRFVNGRADGPVAPDARRP